MQAARVLRVIGPDRMVVALDETHSAIELQLEQPLPPETLARARCFVDPFHPMPVRVTPGRYHAGVFWSSHSEPLCIPAVERARTDYRALARKKSQERSSAV